MWYLLAIDREVACWRDGCIQKDCPLASLYCGREHNENNSFLLTDCPVSEANATIFDFGIYLQALQNVGQSRNFLEKLFYCFWWGLQNLRFVH